jgi:hypothetical protein
MPRPDSAESTGAIWWDRGYPPGPVSLKRGQRVAGPLLTAGPSGGLLASSRAGHLRVGPHSEQIRSARLKRMPIKSLLSETSFNSDQTEMIAKAFDDAWAQLQGTGSDPAMSSLVRTALAKRIIEMAQRGGMNAQKAT